VRTIRVGGGPAALAVDEGSGPADRLLVQATSRALLLSVETVDALSRRPVFAGEDLAVQANKEALTAGRAQ
jgi:hypothetical protein